MTLKKLIPLAALYVMTACGSPNTKNVKNSSVVPTTVEATASDSVVQEIEPRVPTKPVEVESYYLAPGVARAYKSETIHPDGKVDVYFTLNEDIIKTASTHDAYGEYEKGVVRLGDKDNDGNVENFSATHYTGTTRPSSDGSVKVDWNADPSANYIPEKESLDFFLKLTEKADSAGIGNVVSLSSFDSDYQLDWKKVSKTDFYNNSFDWSNPSF